MATQSWASKLWTGSNCEHKFCTFSATSTQVCPKCDSECPNHNWVSPKQDLISPKRDWVSPTGLTWDDVAWRGVMWNRAALAATQNFSRAYNDWHGVTWQDVVSTSTRCNTRLQSCLRLTDVAWHGVTWCRAVLVATRRFVALNWRDRKSVV